MQRVLTGIVLVLLLLPARDVMVRARDGLRLWSRLRERQRAAPDVAWDRFYAGLTPYLPSHAAVGLVQAATAGTPAQQRQYYFLQYALAPRLVIPGATEEFVIAYAPPAAQRGLLGSPSFVLVRAFEDEFALYRRTQP
jgi:hypothetical protein